jgi:hypothetical protein
MVKSVLLFVETSMLSRRCSRLIREKRCARSSLSGWVELPPLKLLHGCGVPVPVLLLVLPFLDERAYLCLKNLYQV